MTDDIDLEYTPTIIPVSRPVRDPLSPPWEDCKVCGGDHWTKDHPTTHDTPTDALAAALKATSGIPERYRGPVGAWTPTATAILAAMPDWTLVPKADAPDVCPDCGLTAERIGQIHITAQRARLALGDWP